MSTIVIHGGAGTVPEEYQDAYREGLNAALEAGYQALTSGGDPIEGALAAVSHMEANERAFNAGVGGAPTREGRVELDACVMASDGSAGAVAAVTNSRNPVRLAEKVRTSTPHVILAGEGAERLEQQPVTNESLLTDRAKADLERWRAKRTGEPGRGTVGAVALSDDGRLAAATSTGGILGQYAGRLGDTPVPGAGTWCDPRHALSGTGIGEAFLRSAGCRSVALRVDHGATLEQALQAGLDDLKEAKGDGGFIYLGASGLFGFAFNTPMLAVAFRSPTQTLVEIARRSGVHLFRG
ncbi:MAG TPA: isoaspartyl peptidase/L-asparaginase [Trueperaceae bacterium]